MLAITYTQSGPSSVLALGERPVRDPGPGEVRVRVAVSGVNPTDWKSRRGTGSAGAPLTEPQVPNQDGAGVIDAVGEGVCDLRVGQRVWLWDVAWQSPEGTAAELVTLPARQAVPLPDTESFDTGASLGIPALTAHRALTAREEGPARLVPGALDGTVVLVTGGAGAVGHAAIQLARWAGATVIATVSSASKAELARAAGAAHVVDYRTEDVAAAVRAVSPEGAHVIVDVNVRDNITDDLAVIARGGTISAYAIDGEGDLAIPVRAAMTPNVRVQFVLTYTVTAAQKAAAVEAVGDALADGALRVGDEHGLPLTRFPLHRTGAAHDAVEQGTVGKVLVDVSDVGEDVAGR